MKSDRPPPGVDRHGAGWRARVYVAGAGRSSRTFDLDEPFDNIVEWMQDEEYRLRLQARKRSPLEQPSKRGTFADEAKRYLKAVAAMPDIKRRTKDIELWVVEFGPRRRSSITAAEIRAVRDRWLTVGPKMVYRKKNGNKPAHWESVETPLSGSTVNHRLRALSNLWTVLDGRRAPNPVRDVPEASETPALPRALPYEVIERVLSAMPDRGSAKRFEKRPTVSLTKVRLRVIAWTGLAHKDLAALKREQVDLENGTLLTMGRQKGQGVEPQLLPLLPQAVEALRDYFAAGANTRFSPSSMRKSFLRALEKVDPLPGVRPYDLRHSFGSHVMRRTGNLHVVGELLQHADARTSRRYALAAVNPVLTAALERWTDTPPAGPKAGPEATPDRRKDGQKTRNRKKAGKGRNREKSS